MSFILDALRKSESERRREIAPSFAHAPLATIRRETPRWVWLVMTLLALALIASGTAWWRSGSDALSPVAGRVPEAADPAFDSGGGRSGAIEPVPAANAAPDPAPGIRSITEFAEIDPTLASLRVELVAYNSNDPARGSAWINGRRYFPGEQINGGPELAEIRVDGVLLTYRGARYLLTVR